MVESCYDDSIPAGASHFLKLVTKYGYCQDTLGTEGPIVDGQVRDVLDPCNDLYMLMCFAAAQVAVGSVQILSCVIGKIKNKKKVEPEGKSDVEGTGSDDASNGGMTVLGVLSWIAGIIMLSIYTSAETFKTTLPNADSLRFFNSFKAAVILNVVLFSFGLLFIATITGIFVFTFIFKKGRLGTLFTFIFSVIVMGIATSFYGCIAFYGWPYVHGSCVDDIQSYNGTGYSNNTVTVTIDTNWLLTDIDVDTNKTLIENDLNAIFKQKWYAGPQADCTVDDDCEVVMHVCNSGFCGTVPPTTTPETTTESTTKGTIRRAKKDGNNPVPDPVCAKGLDCGKGKTCKDGQCVDNAAGKCGSKLDCKADETCDTFEEDKKEVTKCRKRVPLLNLYNYEFGHYFYDTECTLIPPSNGIRSGDLDFSCFFNYEAKAIVHRIENPLQEDSEDAEGDNGFYSDDSLECNLLDQQFRQFQLDMLTLKAFKAEKLALNDCSVEQSVITTPVPTSPMPETTSSVDGSW